MSPVRPNPIDGGPVHRNRAETVSENSDALHKAAIEDLSLRGWHGLTAADVSRRAGLTTGAFYNRYLDSNDFALDLWFEELQGILFTAIDKCISALREERPGIAFARAMKAFVHPEPRLIAAIELVLAAQFNTEPLSEISSLTSRFLSDRVLVSDHVTPEQATVAATICFEAFGLALLSSRPWTAQSSPRERLIQFGEALLKASPSAPLPEFDSEYLRQPLPSSGDPRLDHLLTVVEEVIGTIGYHRTTVAMVCRAADVSSGFVFSRFATKFDLFAAVIDRAWSERFRETAALTTRLGTDYGPGVAEALVWRELMRPSVTIPRAIYLETNRLMRYDPAMANLMAIEDQRLFTRRGIAAPIPSVINVRRSIGLGIAFVARLVEDVRDLPFGCVTEHLAPVLGR